MGILSLFSQIFYQKKKTKQNKNQQPTALGWRCPPWCWPYDCRVRTCWVLTRPLKRKTKNRIFSLIHLISSQFSANPTCSRKAWLHHDSLWCPCLWPQAGASPAGLAFLCCASLWWVTGVHMGLGKRGQAVCSHLCMAAARPGGEHQHTSFLQGTRALWVGAEHVCGLYFPSFK